MAKKQAEIKLGSRVRDTITGLEGVAVALREKALVVNSYRVQELKCCHTCRWSEDNTRGWLLCNKACGNLVERAGICCLWEKGQSAAVSEV